MNRQERRRRARLRRAGAAGMGVLAGATALFGGYVGNPRLPRA